MFRPMASHAVHSRPLAGLVNCPLQIMRNEKFNFMHLIKKFYRLHQTCEFLLSRELWIEILDKEQ